MVRTLCFYCQDSDLIPGQETKILQATCVAKKKKKFLDSIVLALEKAEEPEVKLPASIGSLKKEESSRKTSSSALLTMPKPLTVWITINCGKF